MPAIISRYYKEKNFAEEALYKAITDFLEVFNNIKELTIELIDVFNNTDDEIIEINMIELDELKNIRGFGESPYTLEISFEAGDEKIKVSISKNVSRLLITLSCSINNNAVCYIQTLEERLELERARAWYNGKRGA